jgi:putative peptidoglycan lipid II flippase
MFTKKTIIKKTIEVGTSTIVSRFFGAIREILMARYLGANALSDAFINAFKIPNTMRKMFAEGALSATVVPTIVKTMRSEGKHGVNSVVTLGFVFFEGLLLLVCALCMWKAEFVLWLVASGSSAEQLKVGAVWLRTLMPFILFISSSALLAGAFQSVGHFFVPAFSPVLLNIVFIIGLAVCLFFNLPIIWFCWFILLAGLLQFLWHLHTYFKLHFNLTSFDKNDIKNFLPVVWKFLLCLPSAAIEELNVFIDTWFASYLAAGSVSLISYANKFMGIPLGVFGVALSTILLPHFSRITTYAPKRLGFYLLESSKVIIWFTLPVALLMAFFSQDIFCTLFLSAKFDLSHAMQAAIILQIFLVGLIFFSINKILRNIYYAHHAMEICGLISAGSLIFNIAANWILVQWFDVAGLALATVLSGILQTFLFIIILHEKFHVKLYIKRFTDFLLRYSFQLMVTLFPFWISYRLIMYGIKNYTTESLSYILLQTIGLWFWVGPLCALCALALFYFRRSFKISLYFID